MGPSPYRIGEKGRGTASPLEFSPWSLLVHKQHLPLCSCPPAGKYQENLPLWAGEMRASPGGKFNLRAGGEE